MLFLDQQASQSIQRLRRAGAHGQSCLVLGCGHRQLIVVDGVPGLGHGEPELRSGESIFDRLRFVAVLFSLCQVADGTAKVFLLHAQKPHARRHSSVLRLTRKDRQEPFLRLIGPVCVEGGKGCALLLRTGDAGVHLRQLLFILLDLAGKLHVLRMPLEILPHVRGGGWIGCVPNERLAKTGLHIRILRMRLENTNALSAGLCVVGQQHSKLNSNALVTGVTLRKSAHP